MTEASPFFSICVPTRNRPETLIFCLKTLLHQDFESYEIIISDNCDEEESKQTFKIIQDLNSDKIKYFKPDSILSMTQNYEFALSKAAGQFIMCLGDDDGLLINSLLYVFNFIKEYDAKVVKCAEIVYWWPGNQVYPKSSLTYPLERPVMQVMSKSILQKVANFELSYFNLPMLYYSFVAREIIESVVKEKGSFFQNSASIDMYSGFVIAYKTDKFFVADKPFVVPGLSSKSTGSSATSTYQNKIAREFLLQHSILEDYEKYQIPFPDKFNMPIFVWFELTKFVANFGLKDYLYIDYRKIIADAIANNAITENVQELDIIENFKKYPAYENDVKYIKKHFSEKSMYYLQSGSHNTNLVQSITVDPMLFSITDVYGASILCKRLIEARQKKEPIPLQLIDAVQKKPGFLNKAFIRIKRTCKVFLTGHY